jgi:hypothetical protein
MKKFKCALLVAMMTMCSVSSYASWYDRDEITIPKSYINNTGQTYLLEKAARIFGTSYELTLTNIYLSEYWFCCDIVIDEAEYGLGQFEVTQECSNEYDQSHSGEGTTSSISWSRPYDLVVHSEVRLYNDGVEHDGQNGDYVVVTYHFTRTTSTSGTYQNDDYYLIVKFPYTRETWTGINAIDVDQISVEYYDIQGRKLNGPQPGIVIERQGNKTTKKLYR